MNPIIAYEQRYINLEELALVLWDFGTNQIYEVGEKCFSFYCHLANRKDRVLGGDDKVENDIDVSFYYIKKYRSDLNGNDEWFGE